MLSSKYAGVIVIIGVNNRKSYAVSPAARGKLLGKMLLELGMKNVVVATTDDYIWRYAHAQNATALYRGVRSWSHDGLTECWLLLLNVLGPIVLGCNRVLPTWFIEADPAHQSLSSSLLRRRLREGAPITGLVPPGTEAEVAAIYAPPTPPP